MSKLVNAVDRLPAVEVYVLLAKGYIQVEVLEQMAEKCLKKICFRVFELLCIFLFAGRP